jgi:hypothetical protein
MGSVSRKLMPQLPPSTEAICGVTEATIAALSAVS